MENKKHGPEANTDALWQLKVYRRSLTRHQYRTLRGQIIAGDAEGAMRGLHKLLQRETAKCENVSR